MNPRAEWPNRGALVVVFLIGVGAIWLAPRPPMIDLPQFAGQIALLDGLLRGTSPWSPELRIDALTPYLIGYALTVPLSLFLPVVVALKIVLTAALAGFSLAATAIRRELGSARALDAYALIGFFGFDYAWGLYTFLVAAPLGLLVVWLSLRYARQPSLGRGLAITVAGDVLLFAHALVLLFATGVGVLITLARAWSGGPRAALLRTWPYAAPLTGGLLIYLLARHAPGGGGGFGLSFGPLGLRLMGVLFSIDARPERRTVEFLVALLALPFVSGLKIHGRCLDRLVVAGAVFGALALAPATFWSAAGLYMRFALFAPAAWAWLFSDGGAPAGGVARLARPHLALLAPALAGLILAQHVVQAARFAHESADFDAVMAMARPGQRALGLVLDETGAADVDLPVYRHFPLWYQAEKGGLVDPSFAASPPSIVRYRQNPPGLSDDAAFADHPDRFGWRRDDGGQWTYFFVRATRPIPATLFAGADCPPATVGASGAWTLFKERPCAATPR